MRHHDRGNYAVTISRSRQAHHPAAVAARPHIALDELEVGQREDLLDRHPQHLRHRASHGQAESRNCTAQHFQFWGIGDDGNGQMRFQRSLKRSGETADRI
jgi:hypothetical protein